MKIQKVIFLILILTTNCFAEDITYEKIINKDYKNKEEFIKDSKELLIRLNKKHKQEITNFKDPKILINITKMNYARLLNQFSYIILHNHFNAKQDKFFSSFWKTINYLNLKEGLKYIKQNNPELRLKNLQKGNYVNINFTNKSLKRLEKNPDGTYHLFYRLYATSYKNFKRNQIYPIKIEIIYTIQKNIPEINNLKIEIN